MKESSAVKNTLNIMPSGIGKWPKSLASIMRRNWLLRDSIREK
jgi:hypothetical protein